MGKVGYSKKTAQIDWQFIHSKFNPSKIKENLYESSAAIKDSLLSLTGVENVEVDFRNKQVAVVFDKSVMDAQTIMNAIEQNSHWCFVNQIQKAKKAKRFGTLL